MSIKLLALDLDETLLTTDKKVSEGNRRALKACMDRGLHVITASGRFNISQINFIKMIGLGLENKLHLGDGGGSIFDGSGIKELMGVFDPSAYQNVIEQVRDLKIPCLVTNGINVFYEMADCPVAERYRETERNTGRKYIYRIPDLMQVENPLKVVFLFRDQRELERICAVQHPDTVNISTGGDLREITMRSMTKLSGLKKIAEMYGVTMDEIACFGDSENDIPMLQGAGLGLAVANAQEKVKVAADFVGEKTNDEDGVAWLIEKYIL